MTFNTSGSLTFHLLCT